MSYKEDSNKRHGNGRTFKIGCNTISPKKVSDKRVNLNCVMTRASNPLRFKTELCRSYQESGKCRFEEGCTFAHGVAELRAIPRHPKYKTELCNTYHRLGICKYGSRCHFIHTLEDFNTTNLLRHGFVVEDGAVETPKVEANDSYAYVFWLNLQRLCELNGALPLSYR